VLTGSGLKATDKIRILKEKNKKGGGFSESKEDNN